MRSVEMMVGSVGTNLTQGAGEIDDELSEGEMSVNGKVNTHIQPDSKKSYLQGELNGGFGALINN